jgi:hypothetical protein
MFAVALQVKAFEEIILLFALYNNNMVLLSCYNVSRLSSEGPIRTSLTALSLFFPDYKLLIQIS